MTSSKFRLLLAALIGVVLTLVVQKYWLSDPRDPYSFFELGSEIGKTHDEKMEIYRQQILAYFDEYPHKKEAPAFFSTMGIAGFGCWEHGPPSAYEFMCEWDDSVLVTTEHFSVFINFESDGKTLSDLKVDLGVTSL